MGVITRTLFLFGRLPISAQLKIFTWEGVSETLLGNVAFLVE